MRRRRWRLLLPLLSITPPAGAIALATTVMLVGAQCPLGGGTATASTPSAKTIPQGMLTIYQQVGQQYNLPWQILAGIGQEECDHGRNPDPSCTPQPGATGPGAANCCGASGPMQIGIGGASGNSYDPLRHYLPNPALGPHDPTTAVQLAALLLIHDKGAAPGQPIDAYRAAITAYNGSGPIADAYATRVLADAHSYGDGGLTGGGCAATNGTNANPFQGDTHIVAERIDMGVDYTDPQPETIHALDGGTITWAGPEGGGWDPNAVNETLANPPTPTEKYAYVAEHITPLVHTGQTVTAGQPIATFIPGGGIEIGWGSNPGTPFGTRAALFGQQAGNGDAGDNRTACGQSMSDLIRSAGGPAGLTEGKPISRGSATSPNGC